MTKLPEPALEQVLDRVDALDVVARSVLFGALSPEARRALADQMEAATYQADEEIVREGDPGDRYFLIASGEAEVLVSESGGQHPARMVGKRGPAEGFGEMALLGDGVRHATVRARTALRLWSLRRCDFLDVLDRHRGLALAVEQEMMLRHAVTSLAVSSLFTDVPVDALHWIALRLTEVHAVAGQEIIRQGEPGDALYIVRSGRVEVVVYDEERGPRQLNVIGPGEAFGEQALLSGQPRSATVRALEPVAALRLGKDDFEVVLATYESRRTYFFQLALRRQSPTRVDGWTLQRVSLGEQSQYILRDRRGERYLKLAEPAAFLWDLLDGRHTVRELAFAFFARYRVFGVDTVLDTMLRLHAAGCVHLQDLTSARSAPVPRTSRLAPMSNVLIHYFSLPSTDAAATMLYRLAFRPLFNLMVQILLLLVAVAGTGLFGRYLFLGDGPTVPEGGLAMLTLVGFLGSSVQIILHELAHAMTCKHFGREVHRAGIGWYLFIPVAFVDTSDIWLERRVVRMAVAAAGPYTNVVLSGLATLLIPVVQDATVRAALFHFALLGYGFAVLNMNPLIRFDGYYVLMDWLEIPNLRQKSFALWGALIWGTPRPAHDRRLTRILGAFGVLALVYTAFMAFSILTGYQGYLEGALRSIMPTAVAGLGGWAVAGLLVILILRGVWDELRPDVSLK